MLNEILFVVYMVALALFAWKHTDRTKTVPWLVGNCVWLGGAALLAFVGVWGGNATAQCVYGGLGVLSAVVAVARMGAGVGEPAVPVMTNLLTYGKTFVTQLLFWPVLDFEELYTALK